MIAIGTLGAAAAGASPGTPWLKEQPFDDMLQPPRLVPAVHVARPPSLGARAARYARRLSACPTATAATRRAAASTAPGSSATSSATSASSCRTARTPTSDSAATWAAPSLRPGDLVFFDGVGHVGMYVGAGSFIHAPHSGTTVRISSLNDPWYSSRYDGARRVVRS